MRAMRKNLSICVGQAGNVMLPACLNVRAKNPPRFSGGSMSRERDMRLRIRFHSRCRID